jgi:hypothetical protein
VQDVAEGERERRVELADDAGAGDLVFVGEYELFVEAGFTGADLLGGVEKDG